MTRGSAGAKRGKGRLALGRLVLGWLTGLAAILVLACGTVVVLHAHHGQEASAAVRSATRQPQARPAVPLATLRLVSVAPAAGADDVDGAQPVRLTLSGVAAATSRPRISPPAAGAWSQDGDSLTFTPSAAFPPGTRVTISVPGGRASWSTSFRTGSYSTLRLQQLLAQLGYLPLSWSSLGQAVMPGNVAAQLSAAYQPPAGRFTWVSGYPPSLASFWQQGQGNLIDTGAIMAFESQHGMTLDGLASPALWTALLLAAETQQGNPDGYTYAIASKVLPETLTIWHGGRQVFRSLANTGIPVAPTDDGTFPVYLRYRYQVMQGTNPDGTHYADPVQFVSYFQAGEAVHYFPRYSYGFPQSLGCVELPLAAAAQAWPYLTYGSLVTVTP